MVVRFWFFIRISNRKWRCRCATLKCSLDGNERCGSNESNLLLRSDDLERLMRGAGSGGFNLGTGLVAFGNVPRLNALSPRSRAVPIMVCRQLQNTTAFRQDRSKSSVSKTQELQFVNRTHCFGMNSCPRLSDSGGGGVYWCGGGWRCKISPGVASKT